MVCAKGQNRLRERVVGRCPEYTSGTIESLPPAYAGGSDPYMQSVTALVLSYKENIPRPTPELSVLGVFHLCAISELVSELVDPF